MMKYKFKSGSRRLVSLLEYYDKEEKAMTDTKRKYLHIRKEGKKASASFRNIDKITAVDANLIRQDLIKIICERGTRLELDLRGIRFIDNEGFDALNLLYRLGRKYGSTLALKGVEPELLEMINLVKKYHVFHVQQIRSAC
jgi:anti-anti-sigma regulatory factor